ncbi:Uncharacterized protein BC88300_02206 [Bacillus cytotoxicus]|uniref:Lon proteolytic domain-containing protein n=1 Tax=Bacillus cytotoxicus TaxID=580165 RepID=A0AAX2CGW9_9BACI|nr:Uncharacterized protein BCB44BAC_02139 [Bacillus cytotoxicus]SCN36617.1 Uncharacterized protein BC88300_02206 [Bacillus cytotoxicus]
MDTFLRTVDFNVGYRLKSEQSLLLKWNIYTATRGKTGMIGTYKLETEVVSGTGKFEKTGLNSDRDAKESIDTAFRFFKANHKNMSGTISTTTKDYLMHIQDIHGVGLTGELSLAAFIALCSGALSKPVQNQMVVLGSISISGTINKVEELANVLQVCFDSGAKKILLPMASAVDIPSVPPELFAKFQIAFYQSAEDSVFKALGFE